MALRLPREFGLVNWLGLRTHIGKEVQRFLKVGLQTLAAPVITSLMFLAIFSLALGRSVQEIGGVAFMEFLAPGLIMMAVIQNAFNNTVSSVMVSKIQGNIGVMFPSRLRIYVGFYMRGRGSGCFGCFVRWSCDVVFCGYETARYNFYTDTFDLCCRCDVYARFNHRDLGR